MALAQYCATVGVATVRAPCVYICVSGFWPHLVLTFLYVARQNGDKEENAFFSQSYETRESESLVCARPQHQHYYYGDGNVLSSGDNCCGGLYVWPNVKCVDANRANET